MLKQLKKKENYWKRGERKRSVKRYHLIQNWERLSLVWQHVLTMETILKLMKKRKLVMVK